MKKFIKNVAIIGTKLEDNKTTEQDRKILKVGSSYMVTLPMDIVRGFGWDENTRIKVSISDGPSLEY
ncbi:MAG: AbrB/MazE/SpoVT family DNA-binding domain-containing protein [Methanocellales archaeon]|nr:AbrB/MazE/SpoVT family DNA-binding domain-containing protein [Methanocellales archaeon]